MMKTDEEKAAQAAQGCGYLLATLAVMACMEVWSGYVFQKLWTWFAVTQLQAPMISLPGAIGIMVGVAFSTKQYIFVSKENSSRPEGEKLSEYVGYCLVWPGVCLLIGSIAKHYL